MTGPAIKIAITADADDAVRGFHKAGDAADRAAKDFDHAGREARDVGEDFDRAGSNASQAAGGFGDLGGALSAIPGPIGAVGTGMETLAPFIMGVTGAADLAALAHNALKASFLGSAAAAAKNAIVTAASTTAQIAAGAAAKVAAAGQWLLNAAMAANPIGLVVIAIAALVAGFILAYRNSETFRRIVNGALGGVVEGFKLFLSGVQYAFGWVRDHWPLIGALLLGPFGLVILGVHRYGDQIVGFFSGMPARIRGAVTGLWDPIKNSFKDAINYVIRTWNNLELSIPPVDTHIPGVGQVGGFSLGTPNIPLLARGGIVSSPTLAVVGERGPEAVVPLNRLGGNTINVTVNVPPVVDRAEVGREIVRAIQAYQSRTGLAVAQ